MGKTYSCYCRFKTSFYSQCFFLKLVALIGDGLRKLAIPFPLTSFRYKNMTTNNVIMAIDKTYKVAPNPPYKNLENATNETIKWLRQNKN